MDPTKLVSHFSEFSAIFYAIYKFQPKLKYYLRIHFYHSPETLSFLTDKPLVCRIPLGKIWRLAIGSPGRPAGAGGSIPAIADGGSGRGGQGSDLGVLGDWFGVLDGVEAASGEVLGGGQRGSGRHGQRRHALSRGTGIGGLGSFWGC
jgi:hypothetical protein